MVREHLVEPGNGHQRKAGHGVIRKDIYIIWPSGLFLRIVSNLGPDEMLALRWNSQFGSIFVDGSHFRVRTQ